MDVASARIAREVESRGGSSLLLLLMLRDLNDDEELRDS